MPAVERDLLDGLCRHHVSHDARRPIEEWQFRADHDGFAPGVDRQLKVADQGAADLERQRVDALGSESWSLGRDLVRAGRDGRHVIAALTVARGGAGEPGGGIAHHDRRARNGRAGWIEHATL